MVGVSGADGAQQAASAGDDPPDVSPAGALSTIEEEPEGDQDMVGPVAPRAKKRRVSLQAVSRAPEICAVFRV